MCRQRKKGVSVLFVALFLGVLWAFAPTVLALSGGDSYYGYRYTDSNSGGVKYSWEDIETIGTELKTKNRATIGSAISLAGDKEGSPRFNFEFYGKTYSSIYLAGNGFVAFSYPVKNHIYDRSGIPSTNSPNNLIAPLWGWNDTFS